jgi:hypothetical protein
MAPTPIRHPLRPADPPDDPQAQARAQTRVRALHPSATQRTPARVIRLREDGSMTTEYGLVVVVGATLASIVIKWASGGAVFELLGAVLSRVKAVVGL